VQFELLLEVFLNAARLNRVDEWLKLIYSVKSGEDVSARFHGCECSEPLSQTQLTSDEIGPKYCLWV
jgi:hypothetical protein